jgi:tetratricopeptide (TPR) repeat protein
MMVRLMSSIALFVGSSVALAQSSSEAIAAGDRAYAALQPAEALAHFEAAVAADSMSYEARWKLSRSLVDLGESERDAGKQRTLYRSAQAHARRAVELQPADAEGHFSLARALGRAALSVGVRERVKYAKDVRKEALLALAADPRHAGALHVLGVWNAEVMRLNGMERFFAKNVLGGKVFGTASWKDAISYMEQAVAADPQRLTHHLDLAKIYRDVGNKAKAREHFEIVVNGTATDFNDPAYKREAEAALKKLG